MEVGAGHNALWLLSHDHAPCSLGALRGPGVRSWGAGSLLSLWALAQGLMLNRSVFNGRQDFCLVFSVNPQLGHGIALVSLPAFRSWSQGCFCRIGRRPQGGLAGERGHENKEGKEGPTGCGQQEPSPTGDLWEPLEDVHSCVTQHQGHGSWGYPQSFVERGLLPGHLPPGTSSSPCMGGAGASTERQVVWEAGAGG